MPCNASEAAHLARLLISGYPNSALTEPEYYIAQVVTVFTKYDVELVRKAVAPSGIPYEISKFLPTVGEIEKWLRGWEDKVKIAQERDVRRIEQIKAREDWLAQPATERMKLKAKAWLDRTDPTAQELSGSKPKALTEEQKKAALESAAKVGKEIAGMRLLPETLATLKGKEPHQSEQLSPDSCTRS